MIRVEVDAVVRRPIDVVFDRLVDIAAYPEWMSNAGIFIDCTQDPPGPVKVGTRYTDVTRLGTVHGEVVELERPTRVVFHYRADMFGRRMMDGWPGYTLEPVGADATRIRHIAEGRLHGAFRLLHPVIQLIAGRERRLTVDALKRSLEAEGPEQTATGAPDRVAPDAGTH